MSKPGAPTADDREMAFIVQFAMGVKAFCPVGEQGQMFCPKCGKTLYYRVDSATRSNGAVRIRCETENCMNMIE